jgi:hypothetical protein
MNMQHNHTNIPDNEYYPPDPADEQRLADEVERLLLLYGEPAHLEPPPDLVARIEERLPAQPPLAAAAVARRHRRRVLILQGILALAVLFVFGLGTWGVLVDSGGLARLFGVTTAGLGELVLMLVLIAKPLVNGLLAPGLPVLVAGTLVGAGLCWVWWQLAQQPRLVHSQGAG